MISTVNHYSAYNYFSREAGLVQSHAGVRRKTGLSPYCYEYFGSTALLCWRSDAIYTGLRSHLMLAMSAYHFCWRAARNHCRITFVGFDGDRLSRAAHGSWSLHVRRAQTPRDAYPRLRKQNRNPCNTYLGASDNITLARTQDGVREYTHLQQGSDLARYLRHVRATRRISDSGHKVVGESAIVDVSRSRVNVQPVSRSQRDRDAPNAVHGLRYANSLVRSSWSSTQATPGGYYSNPNARVRTRVNAYLTISQKQRHLNVPLESQVQLPRPDYLHGIGPGLGDARTEFGLNAGRGVISVDDRYNSRKIDLNVVTTVGRGVARADILGRARSGLYVQPPAGSERGGRVAYSRLRSGPPRSGAHWIGAHSSQYRRSSGDGDAVFRRAVRAPRPGRFDPGLNAVADTAYRRFVTNPNLSQTDLVIFANPALTPSLVKQARQLGLPTLGLHSALRSGTDTRRRVGNPGLSFGILGNPNNPWLSFNLGVSLLKLNRLASAGARGKPAIT